jgi:hypothetical protein
MNDLEENLLSIVYSFLLPVDIARLSSVNKYYFEGNEVLSKYVWQMFIADKWGVNPTVVQTQLSKFSAAQLRKLFPYCSQVIQGIYSSDADIRMDPTSGTVAEFVGRVGESNRSIRGSHHFPSLPQLEVLKPKKATVIESMISFASFLAEKYLIDCIYHDPPVQKAPTFDEYDRSLAVISHSTPFVSSVAKDGSAEFYVKPRFVSYYEVEICPPTVPSHRSVHDLEVLAAAVEAGIPGTELVRSECVAVGLATKSFMKNKRLPGWDALSYGYHGDDGGIFHGQGRQLCNYGPRYGCNDVVGCGLNYRDSTIFFTLNGKMLGTAFSDAIVQEELYPTVGIDSNCSVHFNFGTKPFKFNLEGHLEDILVEGDSPVTHWGDPPATDDTVVDA